MSVLTFKKKQEHDGKPKTFLNFQVGDGLNDIKMKMYHAGALLDHSMNETPHINADPQTKSAFFQAGMFNGPTLVTKVSADYAMVAKLELHSRVESYEYERNPALSHQVNFPDTTINYFILGIDDEGKVFIHWLEQRRQDIVMFISMNIPPTLDCQFIDNYTLKKDFLHNPHNDHWAGFELEYVVYAMNKGMLGFERLQGDIIHQIIEGKKGYCNTCSNPHNGGHRSMIRYSDGRRWMVQKKKLVYKLYPNGQSQNTITMCKDCITGLGDRVVSNTSDIKTTTMRIRIGNHDIKSDGLMINISGLPPGTMMAVDNSILADTARQMWSAQPGETIRIGGKPRNITMSNTIIENHSFEFEDPSMRFDETQKRGYSYRPRTRHMTREEIEEWKDSLPAGMPVATPSGPRRNSNGKSEFPHNSHDWKRIPSFFEDNSFGFSWMVSQSGENAGRQIIAMGGQNVILEHPQHKEKHVYVPEDSIALFQSQITHTPVQALD